MDMGAILGQQLMQTAQVSWVVMLVMVPWWMQHDADPPPQVMEDQVDAEMKRLENMDEDDLEAIKRKRMDMMKKQQEKKTEWRQQGHGEYSEIPEEKGTRGR